jgi:pimeloyl-ACP methyl ester carboxylesterase
LPVRSAYIATNGIRLHVVRDGPPDGPLTILLHGFPEFHYGWRRQLAFLGSAGYRVWAPDQRGYNLSAKPKAIAAYRLDTLGADILGLIDAAGCTQAHLVGHDWGAAVAWWLAATHPDRIKRLVVLNVPHPAVMQQHLRQNPAQLARSWYIFFFQIPWLPEHLARFRRWQIPIHAMQTTSRAGTFTARELRRYRRAWSQPGAFPSMLNWYRAMVRCPPRLPAMPRITPPTLIIWGARDKFLDRAMAQPSIDLCDNGRLVLMEDATHWVQHEKPNEVNRLIEAFLRDRSPDDSIGAEIGIREVARRH